WRRHLLFVRPETVVGWHCAVQAHRHPSLFTHIVTGPRWRLQAPRRQGPHPAPERAAPMGHDVGEPVWVTMIVNRTRTAAAGASSGGGARAARSAARG